MAGNKLTGAYPDGGSGAVSNPGLAVDNNIDTYASVAMSGWYQYYYWGWPAAQFAGKEEFYIKVAHGSGTPGQMVETVVWVHSYGNFPAPDYGYAIGSTGSIEFSHQTSQSLEWFTTPTFALDGDLIAAQGYKVHIDMQVNAADTLVARVYELQFFAGPELMGRLRVKVGDSTWKFANPRAGENNGRGRLKVKRRSGWVNASGFEDEF